MPLSGAIRLTVASVSLAVAETGVATLTMSSITLLSVSVLQRLKHKYWLKAWTGGGQNGSNAE